MQAIPTSAPSADCLVMCCWLFVARLRGVRGNESPIETSWDQSEADLSPEVINEAWNTQRAGWTSRAQTDSDGAISAPVVLYYISSTSCALLCISKWFRTWTLLITRKHYGLYSIEARFIITCHLILHTRRMCPIHYSRSDENVPLSWPEIIFLHSFNAWHSLWFMSVLKCVKTKESHSS